MQRWYKGECTRRHRLALIALWAIVFESMVRWVHQHRIKLKDWHAANINFKDGAPPVLVLVDFDKNEGNSTAGPRELMKGGVQTFEKNISLEGLKEPWRGFMKDVKQSIKDWWGKLGSEAAQKKDVDKLRAKWYTLDSLMPPDSSAAEKSGDPLDELFRELGSAESASAASASISEGFAGKAPSGSNRISGLTLVRLDEIRPESTAEIPEEPEESLEPDWEESCEEVDAQETASTCKGEGSSALDWLTNLVDAQYQLMNMVHEQPCHGRTPDMTKFKSRYERQANPALNVHHDPVQLHLDRGQVHCDVNNNMLGWLFRCLLGRIELYGWIQERSGKVKIPTKEPTKFHSRQITNFLKMAGDWKNLSREAKTEKLDEFVIQKFSTDRHRKRMRPADGDTPVANLIQWPNFWMTDSEKAGLVQDVIADYLAYECYFFPNHYTP